MADATPCVEIETLSEELLAQRAPRAIVLCFDGTNGQYDAANTNVVKLFGLLRKDCPEQQIAYYQAGIGTYFAPGVVSPLWTQLASLLDEAFAWYLDAHIMAGYKYIMENYRTGDKICLFGFSRGAYTARALAGMLVRVGLLPRDNIEQIGFAYKAFKRTDKEGIELAAGFKQTFSQDVKVEFVGVWDTVQSTGVLVNRVLPFTESNSGIRIFRHALSLDEHRSRFRPNLYHRSDDGWDSRPNKVAELIKAAKRKTGAIKSSFIHTFKRQDQEAQHRAGGYGILSDRAQQEVCSNDVGPNEALSKADLIAEEFLRTDVLEVWFAGCHSDVGGGNVGDGVEVSLAQIPLHWMVEQIMESQCGILFDEEQLARIGFHFSSVSSQPPNTCNTLAHCKTDAVPMAVSEDGARPQTKDFSSTVAQEMPKEQPAPNAETFPEHSDAIAPSFDELQINKIWWILEFIPSSYVWQDSNGKWHSKWSINFGRGRSIPFERPKFHHSVKERMDYKPLGYKPRAIYNQQEVYV